VKFLHERLPNGLDVIAEVTDTALSTSIGFFVKTGARDETDAEWGVSHFLEHMVFKGTNDLSADEINRRFDWMGASANAFTSEEDTAYHAAVLPEQQIEATALLARMMRPALREDDFDTEKLVILEEIRMYDDQPPFGADDRCRATFFGHHPLARSVLGTVESIERMPVEAMRDYHRRRYSPANIVLCATGAVDFEALVSSAREWCGDWEPLAIPPRRAPLDLRAAHAPTLELITRPTSTLEYAVKMSRGPAGDDDDRFAAKLLAAILGDTSGSRLYWAMVDTGRAEQASCHHQDFLDAGMFATQLSCDPEDAEELLGMIDEVYRGAAEQGLDRREFEQNRNKLAGRWVLLGERPRRRLFDVGPEWAHSGDYRSVADDLRTIENLSLEDVHRVLARWPLHGTGSTVLAGPLPLDPSLETASEAQ
jgi:predicted Zn-dependent peptidase